MSRSHLLASLIWCFFLVCGTHGTSAQTAGRIIGTVTDASGALIVHADIEVENDTTHERYSAETDYSGTYFLLHLTPATYKLKIEAPGFSSAILHPVIVVTSSTTTINTKLQIAYNSSEVTVRDVPPLVRSDSPELASTFDSRAMAALPLPSRNLLQLLTLAPGVTAPLSNNNVIGRNTPNVSINGLRVTQNSYRINDVDVSDISLHVFTDVPVPAPESVSEFDVSTSMYDAAAQGAGGSLRVLTKTGGNVFHGSTYEYLRNEAFNANDANLNAAGEHRPLMRRNVFGAAAGGPLRRDKAFFFLSYQGTRENNGATDHSVYKDVLIAPGLTDDRSAATLQATFKVPAISPSALQLLNAKLPGGHFLIPTPQRADGLVTGIALSSFHEDQFNTNVDYRIGPQDAMAVKLFFARAPVFNAISGSNFGTAASLPGFGTTVDIENQVLCWQEIHTFSTNAINEGRFGYTFTRHDELPQEAIDDSSIGIRRSNAAQYPGLPLILLARDQGGASIGTSDITYRGTMSAISAEDILSLQRGRHTIHVGGEARRSEWQARAGVFSYGEIDFPTFQDFLIGNTGPSQFISGTTGFAHLGTGLPDRRAIANDYAFFAQDDYRLSPRLTVNLGLRYELDLPPYDSKGRIGGFDPALYRPRMQVDSSGFPVGPPAAGIIEAGNALPRYTLADVTRVGKRVVNSIDPNNLGPRIGVSWSPGSLGGLALRAGYGIFYSRPSFSYLALEYFAPPFFLVSDTSGQPFSNPFATAPPDSSFPLLQPGSVVSGTVIDRRARTPYVQQFNASVQFALPRNSTLQVAYVGSRGVKLFRSVNVNQAWIASLKHPMMNMVTGEVIKTNTVENAPLRAPLQGVSTAFFALNQSSAQSTFHSLQVTFQRPVSQGLQFTASYTLSRSIDNASNPGGGANSDGSFDRSGGLDTANTWGNQLNARSNRGLSDFDHTHRLVMGGVWDLPQPGFARQRVPGAILSKWQLSAIFTAMSGLPADVFDPGGGSLYGLFAGARPNWAAGASPKSAMTNVPQGYYFNPSAFSPAIVQPGQPIPSAHDPTAIAGGLGTDIGDVGRNPLRGPPQSNLDLSIVKRFQVAEAKILEVHADFFNALNHANRDNPISDISSVDFGKSLTYSSSPRIVQLALKLSF